MLYGYWWHTLLYIYAPKGKEPGTKHRPPLLRAKRQTQVRIRPSLLFSLPMQKTARRLYDYWQRSNKGTQEKRYRYWRILQTVAVSPQLWRLWKWATSSPRISNTTIRRERFTIVLPTSTANSISPSLMARRLPIPAFGRIIYWHPPLRLGEASPSNHFASTICHKSNRRLALAEYRLNQAHGRAEKKRMEHR